MSKRLNIGLNSIEYSSLKFLKAALIGYSYNKLLCASQPLKTYPVEKFKYNGFCVEPPEEGWGRIAEYTAKPLEWTSDPGIMRCMCSDDQERLIPTCCLIGFKPNHFALQPVTGVLFGAPSSSEKETNFEHYQRTGRIKRV